METSFSGPMLKRRSKLFLLAPFVAALMSFMSAASAEAAQPPDGSYRQSCQNIKASSRVLKAICQTRYRTLVRTSLAGYRSCAGDIANDNGRLVCREVQGDVVLYEHSFFRGRALAVSSDARFLPGWFNNRASSVRVRRGPWRVCTDNDFRGRCENINRDVEDLNRIGMNDRISSLRRVSNNYPDVGGEVVRPQGSYQQSCRDVDFDGRILSASCRDRRDRYEGSRLDMRTCDRGDDIVNRDGELACEDRRGGDNGGGYGGGDHDGNARLPAGSYQQSCRNAQRDGDTLRAECQDRNGIWRRDAFDLRGCRGDIANNNGELICAGTTSPPPPTPLPGGSYQQSCRNMVFERGLLSGACRSSGGEWRNTSLDTRNCAPGTDIGNANGQLSCAGVNPPPPLPPAPLPGGSYQQSCRNMVFERGLLSGACRSSSGEWRNTSLDIRNCAPGTDIGNANGQLSCAGVNPPPPPPPPPPAPLPAGSYQQSCRSMTLERTTLNGECKNSAGEWRTASLDLRGCAPGADIGNDNGALKCASPTPPPGPRAAPEGSYQKSCRNVTLERGTLAAECQDASGGWKQTSIELRNCRGATDIGNDNGVLKCAMPTP